MDPTDVAFGCRDCRRQYRLPEAKLVARIAAGNRRCIACGGSIEVPPEIEARAAQSPGATVAVRRTTACPCCARVVRAKTNHDLDELSCGFCRLSFALDTQDVPRLEPSGFLRADLATVQAFLERVPTTLISGLVRAALLARAERLELAGDEAERVVGALAGLAHDVTSRGPRLELPLGQADAEVVLSRVLFTAPLVRSSQADSATTVTLAYPPPTSSFGGDNRLIAENVVGLGMLATLGTGFVSLPGKPEEPEQAAAIHHRFALRLTPTADGVSVELAHGLTTARAPTPGTADDLARLAQAVNSNRALLLGYFTLLALFGARAAGAPILAATPETIAARAVALLPHLAARRAELGQALRVVAKPRSLQDLVRR